MAAPAPLASRAPSEMPSVDTPLRLAILGPTASGKSELALDLIEALGEGADSERPAQIISTDASQLYRGMDVGTAKLPREERRGIIHYQIDVLDVTEEASVAAYQRHARADLAAAEATGARGVIVGGSGLYVRALLDDFDFPGTDPAIRASLEARAASEGLPALREELTRLDPACAERIEAHDSRRIIRALEVMQLTSRPFSASLPRYEDLSPTLHVALRPDREALRRRIDLRTETMFRSGLLQETEDLIEQGLREGPTASRAIGYVQALAVLEGEMTASEAQQATAQATKQLASRQFKWLRRDPRIHWFDLAYADDGTLVPGQRETLIEQIVELISATAP